jgi:environmental stress-induced protein Ves
MRKLDARSYRTRRWKNGGGSTTEIARAPEGESLEDFDWRISMARVETAGPFSRFAAVDRSIAILDGDGIVLAFEEGEVTRLDRRAEPFAFPADVAAFASLIGGPTLDFNVMTRRGRYRHVVTRAHFDEREGLPTRGDLTVVFVVAGNAVCEREQGGTRAQVGPHDALVLEGGGAIQITPATPVELLAVGLWRD